MNIKVFEIGTKKNIRLAIQTKTLDEMTCALPQGFYTTFSTSALGARVLGLHAHLQRLYVPAGEMGLKIAIDEKTLCERIALFVNKNLPYESRVRLILTKGSGRVYVGIQPFTPLPENVYINGVHVITAQGARHNPRIKDTGFITESATQRKLLNRDIFEVLLTENGNILEGMTSNFYAIKGRRLITAQRGILRGVTRGVILRIARGQGMEIEYRAPGMEEKFDGAFLTSSSRGVVPIISINNNVMGQGRVGKWTKILMKAYWNYTEKKSELLVG